MTQDEYIIKHKMTDQFNNPLDSYKCNYYSPNKEGTSRWLNRHCCASFKCPRNKIKETTYCGEGILKLDWIQYIKYKNLWNGQISILL